MGILQNLLLSTARRRSFYNIDSGCQEFYTFDLATGSILHQHIGFSRWIWTELVGFIATIGATICGVRQTWRRLKASTIRRERQNGSDRMGSGPVLSSETSIRSLHIELRSLKQIGESIAECNAALNPMAAADEQVGRLQTIPFVGPRLAELVVSTIGDPHRFNNARQISACAGLVPRQFQSGTLDHLGRITGQGPGLLRRVLVQAAWRMQRKETRAKIVFERLCYGQKTRRKKAAVAQARKILVWCWAMMRDGAAWDEFHAHEALAVT